MIHFETPNRPPRRLDHLPPTTAFMAIHDLLEMSEGEGVLVFTVPHQPRRYPIDCTDPRWQELLTAELNRQVAHSYWSSKVQALRHVGVQRTMFWLAFIPEYLELIIGDSESLVLPDGQECAIGDYIIYVGEQTLLTMEAEKFEQLFTVNEGDPS
jgi:hypothetical protein